MNNKAVLTAAVAAIAGGASAMADASTYTATLTQVLIYNNSAVNGFAQNISSSTATWSYDDVTNLVTQTGGIYNVRTTTAPTSTLFRVLTTGLIVGNGGVASASTYSCVEGNFGEQLGLSKDWVVRIVKQVGNYGEVFERNVGTGSKLGISRGINRLWKDGGVMYVPALR